MTKQAYDHAHYMHALIAHMLLIVVTIQQLLAQQAAERALQAAQHAFLQAAQLIVQPEAPKDPQEAPTDIM